MKRTTRKILSLLLTCLMALSLLPMTALAADPTAAGVAAYFNNEAIYSKYGAYDYSGPGYQGHLEGQLISGRLYASYTGNIVTVTGSYFGTSNDFSYYWYQEPRNASRYPALSVVDSDFDVVVDWNASCRGYLTNVSRFVMTSGLIDTVNAGIVTVNGGQIAQNWTSGGGMPVINGGMITINGGSVVSTVTNGGGQLSASSTLDIVGGSVSVAGIVPEAYSTYTLSTVIRGGTVALWRSGISSHDLELADGTVSFSGAKPEIYIMQNTPNQGGTLKVTGGTVTGVNKITLEEKSRAAILAGVLPAGITWEFRNANTRAVEVSTLDIPTSWNGTSNGLTPLDGKAAPTWDLSGATPKIRFAAGDTLEWGTKQTDFVAVTGISSVPATATAGTPLTLTGTVAPNNATNQTIVWSISPNNALVGAGVTGTTFTAASAGTAKVRATVAGGASASADYTQDFTITVNPAGGVVAPGAPTNIAATAGDGQASVSFTAPANDGGSAITGYTVTASPGGRTASGASSPITVTGLTNGTSYTFAVTAANIAGTGPASAASNAVTPIAKPDTTPPTVTAVSPANGSTGVGLTGNISITFSEAIGTTGTVKLNGAALAGTGSWAGNTYTIAYSGLAYNTLYTISVSGFKDAADNAMADNAANSFTTRANSSGSTPSGGGSGGKTPSTPAFPVSVGTVSPAPTTLNGTTSVTVKAIDMAGAIDNAIKTAGNSGEAVVSIEFTAPGSSTATQVTLPKAGMTGLAGKKIDGLIVSDGKTTIQLDANAIAAVNSKATGDVVITVSQVPESKLTEQQKEAAGGRPVFDFGITSDGANITEFSGGSVTVTAPYTPAASENANAIVVYYLDADGNLKTMPNGKYDPATKTVSFTTTHFSLYVIGYNPVSFTDVPSGNWGKDSIEQAAARGLVAGVGNRLFQPERSVTRAEFAQMIANALDLTEIKSGTAAYPDVRDGAWYYPAIMRLKSVGYLDKFTGDFMPDQAITREEMAAILAAVLKDGGAIAGANSINLTGTYTDFDKMSEQYLDDIMVVTVSKMMQGIGDSKFDPAGLTTRAQAATVQMRLVEMLVK